MANKCNNIEQLFEYIQGEYPSIQLAKKPPQTIQYKITFQSGFIINIFKNKTVNFQGTSNPKLKLDLEEIIKKINNLNP